MKKYVVLFLFIPFLAFPQDKYLHFSIDDVSMIFQNLTENQSTYKTAFDEPLLRTLWELHQMYGLTCCLYVFGEYNGFSLAGVPKRYAQDFSSNSEWLKISLHNAVDARSYLQILSAIVGSPDCLADTVRTHYFEAEVNQAMTLNASVLLTADNTDVHPTSYFLSENQMAVIERQEFYADDKTKIKFCKTDFRLDKPWQFKTLLKQNAGESELIVFTHEWLLDYPVRRNIAIRFAKWIRRQWILWNLEKLCKYAQTERYVFSVSLNGVQGDR